MVGFEPALLERLTQEGAANALFFAATDGCTVLYDGYPKATFHWLVLPVDTAIRRAADLRPRHLPLLRRMAALADRLIAHVRGPGGVAVSAAPTAAVAADDDDGHGATGAVADPACLRFQCGFHAVPSLEHLHLHVMSTDLELGCKHKKHYNSFATPFFTPIAAVLRELEAGLASGDPDREVALAPRAAAVDGPMACVHCGAALPTMPAVRRHLAGCRHRTLDADHPEATVAAATPHVANAVVL